MGSTLNLPLSLSHTAAWARAEGICPPTHSQLRGLQPVPDDEVIDLYGGTQHIPLYQMSGFYGKVPTTCCWHPGRQWSVGHTACQRPKADPSVSSTWYTVAEG